jgi:hypothetical protein
MVRILSSTTLVVVSLENDRHDPSRRCAQETAVADPE